MGEDWRLLLRPPRIVRRLRQFRRLTSTRICSFVRSSFLLFHSFPEVFPISIRRSDLQRSCHAGHRRSERSAAQLLPCRGSRRSDLQAQPGSDRWLLSDLQAQLPGIPEIRRITCSAAAGYRRSGGSPAAQLPGTGDLQHVPETKKPLGKGRAVMY